MTLLKLDVICCNGRHVLTCMMHTIAWVYWELFLSISIIIRAINLILTKYLLVLLFACLFCNDVRDVRYFYVS